MHAAGTITTLELEVVKTKQQNVTVIRLLGLPRKVFLCSSMQGTTPSHLPGMMPEISLDKVQDQMCLLAFGLEG